MSEAFDALLEKRAAESKAEGREEGMVEGHAEGLEQGMTKGLEQGISKGLEQGRLGMILDLYDSGTLTKKQAESWLGGLTIEQARAKVASIKAHK